MNFGIMLDAVPRLLSGVPVTLLIVVEALAIGLVLAVILALMRLSGNRIAAGLAAAYVTVFRGTPLLVQIFLIYYGFGQFRSFWEAIGLWGLFRDAMFCAPFALALNTAAYSSEIIRGGILSVGLGQIEAARASGMSRLLLFRRIIVPQAVRQALPAYSNEIILMVKASSLASTITILEVTGIARRIMSTNYAIIEVFVVAGAIYLLINFAVARGMRFLEWRLTPHLRPRA